MSFQFFKEPSAPIIKPGQILQHFKRELASKDKQAANWYLYKIMEIGTNTETGEEMVVYQALYDDFHVWIRPLTMFAERVDTEQYPQVKQKYRFEIVQEV